MYWLNSAYFYYCNVSLKKSLLSINCCGKALQTLFNGATVKNLGTSSKYLLITHHWLINESEQPGTELKCLQKCLELQLWNGTNFSPRNVVPFRSVPAIFKSELVPGLFRKFGTSSGTPERRTHSSTKLEADLPNKRPFLNAHISKFNNKTGLPKVSLIITLQMDVGYR